MQDTEHLIGFDFSTLQDVLEGWPETASILKCTPTVDEPLYGRIHQIFCAAQETSTEPSFPDLAPLLRQVQLRRLYAGSPSRLRATKRSSWPTREMWESFGFECNEHAGGYVLNPRPWSPRWLDKSQIGTDDIFADCYREITVRRDAEVPMDPFLKEVTGYENYVCPGQKETVLSLLFMPAGSTLIVNLPTGAGKTLVAQVPVLMDGLHRGLTLFVVPTIALAIDQARRMEALLKRKIPTSRLPSFAWHGELTDHDRQTIKTNIRQGTQGILFASPEAVTGALLPSLYVANKAGLLKYLVIDEAHLIAQWGDSFRPAFQTLSGVRRGLLRECGGVAFRTVLMSATFSPQNLETLEVLFSPSDNIQMVSAVHLRPEPRYWAYYARDEEEKRALILDLLMHVPRPFIFYVTERKDATYWANLLKQSCQYQRIACFTGDTPNSEREEIIGRWGRNQLDGIVATSAFGVGMDKFNVRSIIHATVAESLDRFYQEVGRAGRDGKASISVTVCSAKDVASAKRMSAPALIGDDNAYVRWQTMFDAAERIEGEDLVCLDLTVTPPHLQQQSDYNVSWNMRTLILMARARLIQLDSLPPQSLDRLADEDEAAFEARIENQWADYYNKLPIRTLDPLHLRQDHFQAAIKVEQQRGAQAATDSLTSLMRAIKGEKEMGDALIELYENHKPDRTVIVSKACRGCPAEPMLGEAADVYYQIPVGLGIELTKPCDISEWQNDFPFASLRTVIFYPTGTHQIDDLLEVALDALVSSYGIREVAANASLWRQDKKLRDLHQKVSDKVLIARDLKDDCDAHVMLPVPRATLLLPWDRAPIPEYLILLNRPLHVILAPTDIQGEHCHKRLIDTNLDALTIQEFLKVATQ
jgi:ATP-dependent DNA helicase RecQ